MSKLDRVKSTITKPIIDKPELIQTIPKTEYKLARQLNPLLWHPWTVHPIMFQVRGKERAKGVKEMDYKLLASA